MEISSRARLTREPRCWQQSSLLPPGTDWGGDVERNGGLAERKKWRRRGGLEGKNAGRCEGAALQPASGRGRVGGIPFPRQATSCMRQARRGKARERERERERPSTQVRPGRLHLMDGLPLLLPPPGETAGREAVPPPERRRTDCLGQPAALAVRHCHLRFGPQGRVLDYQVTFHQVTSWTTRPRLGPQGCVLDHQATFWTTRLRFGPPSHVLDHKATFWTTRPRFGPPSHQSTFWTTRPRLRPHGCVLDHQATFWTTAPRLRRPGLPLCSPQSKHRNER